MSEVIEFRSKVEQGADDPTDPEYHADGWMEGPCICLACGHKTVAVLPTGTLWSECPSCHTLKNTPVNPCCVETGESRWICGCGSEYFYIEEKKGGNIRCALCGRSQRF